MIRYALGRLTSLVISLIVRTTEVVPHVSIQHGSKDLHLRHLVQIKIHFGRRRIGRQQMPTSKQKNPGGLGEDRITTFERVPVLLDARRQSPLGQHFDQPVRQPLASRGKR